MLNSARISAGGIIRKVGRFNMTILARINLSLTGSRFGQGESDNYTSSNRVKRKSQANFLCFFRLGLRRHLLTSTRHGLQISESRSGGAGSIELQVVIFTMIG